MCRPKEEGGRRCASHSPSARRTGRAAVRLYGSDNPITRAAVESLPPEYVAGTIAERAHIAATTTDQELMKLAARDPKKAVVDALAQNPNHEIRRIKPEHGGFDLSDLGIEDVPEKPSQFVDSRMSADKEAERNEDGYLFPSYDEQGGMVRKAENAIPHRQFKFEGLRNFNPTSFVKNYGTNSLLLEALSEYKAAPAHARLAWADDGEDISETEAAHRVRSPGLNDKEYSEVNRFLRTFPRDPETDPEFLRKLVGKRGCTLVCVQAASNPSTPVDVLESIAARREFQCDFPQDLLPHALEKDPNTTSALLAQAADARREFQRDFPQVLLPSALAENPSTPAALLSQIAERPGVAANENLAANPSTPGDVLRKIAHNRNAHAEFETIAANPSTPVDVLEYLCDTSAEWWPTRADYNLALNPNTPLKALERMSRREDEHVSQKGGLMNLIRIRKASA